MIDPYDAWAPWRPAPEVVPAPGVDAVLTDEVDDRTPLCVPVAGFARPLCASQQAPGRHRA